ncbi:TrfA [Pseudomonas tritici]|uniref:TrfA n=1 Tax=Pseudomonas tritici TaxID=2745518 RepID=UPI00387AE2A2
MTELKLTDEEIRQGVVDDRRFKLQKKLDTESSQGVLPFTNERLFEQSNPVLRSAVFTAGKLGNQEYHTEWVEVFSLGSGNIQYRGPGLTVDHEQVLARIMVLARGRSLTKPVAAYQADVLRWLRLDDSGANFKKARKILDDLAAAEIRIFSRPALQRLLALLTSPTLADMADGQFYQQYVKNRFTDHLKAIAEGLRNDQPVNVTMKFLTNLTDNPTTGKQVMSLDPIMALLFDGVNTTLLPFEVYDSLDRFGKKLLTLIASHRDGVFPTRLAKYHEFSGSKSEYESVKRRFKYEQAKRFKDWEEKGFIEPGWSIKPNDDGQNIVSGLKLGETIRIRSNLEVLDTQQEALSAEEDTNDEKLAEFALEFGVEPPKRLPSEPAKPPKAPRKKKAASPSSS